jgi:hypothetical protein
LHVCCPLNGDGCVHEYLAVDGSVSNLLGSLIASYSADSHDMEPIPVHSMLFILNTLRSVQLSCIVTLN